jgi:hypothetical protein
MIKVSLAIIVLLSSTIGHSQKNIPTKKKDWNEGSISFKNGSVVEGFIKINLNNWTVKFRKNVEIEDEESLFSEEEIFFLQYYDAMDSSFKKMGSFSFKIHETDIEVTGLFNIIHEF